MAATFHVRALGAAVILTAAMCALALLPHEAAAGPAPRDFNLVASTAAPSEVRVDDVLAARVMHPQLVAERRAALVAAEAAARPRTVQDSIRDAFSPLGEGAVTWALAIAACESRYNPQSVNASSGAAGLFQFLPSTWRGTPYATSSPFDPDANARAAAWLYQRYGPSQWACRA